MAAGPLKAGWAPPASAVPEGALSSVVLVEADLLRGGKVLSEGSEGSKLPPALDSPVGSEREPRGQMEHHSWESGRHLALPVSQVDPSSRNLSLSKSKLKENHHLSRTGSARYYPGGSAVKNLPAMQETWVRKIPWRRKWQPTPVFLPWKSHGQRSLAGHSPWDCKRVGHDVATKPQDQC